MLYEKISALSEAQVDQYSSVQKRAFLKAYNNAYEQYDHDASKAFAVAHSAAKRGRREGSQGEVEY